MYKELLYYQHHPIQICIIFLILTLFPPPWHPYEAGTHLLYSIIDKNGDNGLGAVTQKKQVLIEDEIQLNGLTAVKHANGRDWWLLVFKLQSPIYYKILLSNESISVEGQGILDVKYNARMGSNSFSPDGSKFCIIPEHISDGSIFYFDVFDFDRCNGELKNRKRYYYGQIPLFNSTDYYAQSAVFSPNSKYLFVNTFKEVYQVNPSDTSALLQKIGIYDGFVSPENFRSFFVSVQKNMVTHENYLFK